MPDQWMTWGLAAAAIATGLVAGVFLTFSDFVMRSLNAAQPAAGMEAMQMINRTVYRSVFMVLLMGMVPVSAAIAALAALHAAGAASAWLFAGGVLYVAGVFLVTAICNVPMNKRLDRLDSGGSEGLAYWAEYSRVWTWWNHVRTIASLGAASCYVVGAILL